MTQLQRLKQLAAMPTHSPEESEELQELVRMTTICTLLFDKVGNQSHGTLCGNCANREQKMNSGWHIVSENGNPTEEGEYLVILLINKNKNAIVTSRYFGNAVKNVGWVMWDQPVDGLVWTENYDSFADEHVYAWCEWQSSIDVELPAGVTWFNK